MKILVTSPHCRPDWINKLGIESQGGQTVVMNKLSISMIRNFPKTSIDIFTRLQDNDPFAKNKIKTLKNNKQIRLIRLPCGPTDKYIPKEKLYGKYIDEFTKNIIKFIQKENITYDILHGHYADGWETVRKISKKIPIPYVLTTHSLGISKKQDCLNRKEGNERKLNQKYNFSIRIKSEENALLHCSKLFPLSSFEKNSILHSYKSLKNKSSKIYPIANGLDLKEFPTRVPKQIRNKIRKKLQLNTDDFIILIPSRVDARKGQLNAIHALTKIPTNIKQKIKLIILCWPNKATNYSKKIQKIINKNNLQNSIIKLPSISHNQMYKYFHMVDVTLLPSQEYFSIAMLESMYSKTPIIASKFSGASDAINSGKSGILVDHNNVNEISKTILNMFNMTKKERQKMGLLANKKVKTNYTWNAITKKLHNQYKNVVARALWDSNPRSSA